MRIKPLMTAQLEKFKQAFRMLEFGILSAFGVVMGGLFYFVYKIAQDNKIYEKKGFKNV